jgi:lysyl-tRNA synthetase class 1
MYGKDLTESAILSNKICTIMGKRPPNGFAYELFLDEKGEKISKSIGNGIGVDEWLRYASPESLSLYMFQKPKSAKKLFFDVIPKNIDEYFSHLNKFYNMDQKDQLNSPVWHIHNGTPPKFKNEITFNSLLNLVSVCNTIEKDVIWGFVNVYDPSLNSTDNKDFDLLIQYSINYYKDFILPNKKYLNIDDGNKNIFLDIKKFLINIDNESSSEIIQTEIYEIGKKYKFENLREFFKLIYQVLLGQEQGPRLGSFIKLYGIEKTIKLIDDVLIKNKL